MEEGIEEIIKKTFEGIANVLDDLNERIEVNRLELEKLKKKEQL